MKRFIALYITVAFLFCACQDAGNINSGYSSEHEQSIGSSSSPASEGSESTPNVQENSALVTIPGFENIPDEAILGVKYYYHDMKWMEVNKLPNLDRYVPMEPENPYFLVIPRYAGSSIKVQTVIFDEKTGKFITDKTTYQRDNIPDGYALIINDLTEAGGPNKMVTVSHNGMEGSCDFTVYNYSGDNDSPWLKGGAYMIEAESRSGEQLSEKGFPARKEVQRALDIFKKEYPKVQVIRFSHFKDQDTNWVYVINGVEGSSEYILKIHAYSFDIMERQERSGGVQQVSNMSELISEDRAVKTAAGAVEGADIFEWTLDMAGDTPIFDINAYGASTVSYRVRINALTGKIIETITP